MSEDTSLWVIYGLREDCLGSNYRYIGYSTITAEKRLYFHLNAAKKYTKPYAIYNWIRSVDYKIVTEVVEICPIGDVDHIYNREKFWINHYRQIQGSLSNKITEDYLLNQTDGGGGAVGYKHTEEECRKRSERVSVWEGVTGADHPLYGRKQTDENKQKMKDWHRENKKTGPDHPLYGKPLSKEHKKKLSEAKKGEKHWAYGTGGPTHYNYGRKHSEESIRKSSESRKGIPLSKEHREKISKAISGEKNYMYGKPSPNRGIPMKEETKRKISESKKGKPNRGIHTRWHTNRDVYDEKCVFCTEIDTEKHM